MTPTQKKRDSIETILFKKGWDKDRWDNLKKTINGEDYRIKMQKTSIRYEVKIGKTWANLRSDYYKSVEITDGVVFIKGIACK